MGEEQTSSAAEEQRELWELQLKQAQVELANTVEEGGLLRQQLKLQRTQLHGQAALAVVSLLTAILAAWSSCRADRKATSGYETTAGAVASISSAQLVQYRSLEQLRDYAAEVASGEPVVVIASSSASGQPPPRPYRPPTKAPPPKAAPPPSIHLPPAPP